MNRRSLGGPKNVGLPLAIVLVLMFAARPAAAQTGPITTQQLFFDTASASSHHGNWLEAIGGIIYTDNVTLTQGGPSDELYVIGLLGNVERQGAPRFDYHVDSDITVVKYGSNVYETQPFGFFDASGDFKIIPGFFSWVGRETFNQGLLNGSAPATPENIESINYLTTGPQFRIQPTLRTSVTLTGTASWVDSFSKSPLYTNIDNYRYSGQLKIDRAFSSNVSGYVRGTYDDVKFKDTTENTDFTQTQAYGGLRVGTQRTFINAEAGYTWINLDDPANDKAHGFTWDAQASRLLSPTQRLSIHWLSQFTDAANLFRLNVDQPTPGGGNNQIVTGQPFRHREFGGDWRIQESRTAFDLAAIYFTEVYDATPLSNRKVYDIYGIASRDLSQSMSVDLGLSYDHSDYYNTGSVTKNLNVLARLIWQVGPRVSLRFIYAYGSFTPNGYVENQIGVIASYALTKGAQARDQQLKLEPTAPTYQPPL
jgi:hypothetical protein